MTSSRTALRRIALAWAALLALLFASLAGAYLPLGAGNLALGLGIAAAKTAIVAVVFMEVGRDRPAVRIAAAFALATLALFGSLSGLDLATRENAPAAYQGTVR